jgi:hypothetical protein
MNMNRYTILRIKHFFLRIGRQLKTTFHRCRGTVVWEGRARASVGSILMGYTKTGVDVTLCKCDTCGKPFASFGTPSGSHSIENVNYVINWLANEVPGGHATLVRAGLV